MNLSKKFGQAILSRMRIESLSFRTEYVFGIEFALQERRNCVTGPSCLVMSTFLMYSGDLWRFRIGIT